MADNARFHNKLHRKNHHTLPTTGYPDSAIDPLASPEEPFKGDFHIVGSLSASYNIYAGHRVGVQASNPNYEVSIQGSLSASRDAFIDNNLVVGNDATVGNSLTSFGDTVLGTTANDGITINAGPIKMPNAINAVDAIIMGGDTNLYRGAANTLQTDDDLYVRANTTLGDACTDTTTINGTLNINCSTVANGIKFSNGSGTYDTNLYRSAADTLKTDDNFEVGSSTRLGDANTDQTVIRGITKIADSSSTNGILFGSGDANYDVNLYRKSADILRTDDAFEVGGGMSITGDFSVAGNTTLGDTCADTTTINGNLVINCTTEANGIRFSNGAGGTDTVLFRGAADTLRTNDAFVAGTTLNVLGNTTLGDANTDQTVIRGITKIADSSAGNGILFGSGDANYDTNLYRSAANELTTDDNFKVAGNTTLGDANTDQTVIRGIAKIADSSATNGILFGSNDANYDTNLYRSAANELRTNDNMIIDGDLTIVGNLTALGTYSRLDTLITGTSSMQIINAGSDLALYVEQKGATDVARFVDDGTTALIVKNGGNVGIGVDSPQGRLHVDGLNTNDSSAEIYVTGSCGWMQHHVSLGAGSWNPLAADCDKGIIFSESTINTGNLLIAPWSNQSNGIRILANGNVGIGVQTAGTKLDVAGDGRFTANAETLKLVGTDHTYIGWFPDGVAAGRKAWTGFGNAAQNYFTITNEINDGSGHIVLSPGTNANVGIGTSTPTSRLHVNGTFRTSGTATIDTINTGTTDTVLVVNASGTVEKRTINSSTWNTTTGVVNGTGTTNYVTKWSDADTITDSIIQDNGTYVGVGIAPSANAKLNVGGTIKASRNDTGSEGGQIDFGRSTDNGSMYGIDVYGNTATPNLRILDLVAASSRMEMNSTGNFGFGTAPNTTDRVRIGGNIYASGTATIGTINAGATDTVLVVDANGTVQRRTINSGAWSGVAGGIVSGSGTTNYVPKWSSSSALTDSQIFDNGTNVGIGTASPGQKLTVSGNIYATGNVMSQSGYFSNAEQDEYIFFDPVADSASIATSSVVRIFVTSSGDVGIGTTTPGTFKLNVNGTFNATGITCTSVNTTNGNITMGTGDLSCDAIGCGAISSGAITTNNNNINAGTGNIAGAIITGSTLRSTGDVVAYYVSDSRLKENKVVLNNSLEKLQKIEAYRFDWKEVDDSICTRRGHDVGLLAQEVREILPEAILERDNGYLSLDYIKMIPLLVSSIKELKAEIEILKAK
jgi:hypothetical protein